MPTLRELSEVARNSSWYAQKRVRTVLSLKPREISHFQMRITMPETTRATVLTPGQVKHLLAVTEVTSRHPERDALVLLLGLSCGLRITETAQVTINDLLLG